MTLILIEMVFLVSSYLSVGFLTFISDVQVLELTGVSGTEQDARGGGDTASAAQVICLFRVVGFRDWMSAAVGHVGHQPDPSSGPECLV